LDGGRSASASALGRAPEISDVIPRLERLVNKGGSVTSDTVAICGIWRWVGGNVVVVVVVVVVVAGLISKDAGTSCISDIER
jgi:hypothetical protein